MKISAIRDATSYVHKLLYRKCYQFFYDKIKLKRITCTSKHYKDFTENVLCSENKYKSETKLLRIYEIYDVSRAG